MFTDENDDTVLDCYNIIVLGDSSSQLPLRMRTVIIDDGVIYVTPHMSGHGIIPIPCAMWDGIKVVQIKRNSYVPLEWLEKEFSRDDGVYEHVRKLISEALVNQS